jgi:hypothetical protein
MKKHFLIGTFVLVAAFNSMAYAQEFIKGQCTLKYKSSVDAKGPCSVYQNKNMVSVKGIVEENGQKYIATIDNSKNEGLLIGAGAFTLADGKLTKNEASKVTWPNGYVLTIKLDAEESYSNPEDPLVAEVLGMQIRTKDPREMQAVIGQKLFQNYAKQNNIAATQKDIDAYIAAMDRFMREDRSKNDARRVEIQQQLKAGTIPAEKKQQLESELRILESLHQYAIEEDADKAQDQEAILKVRQEMAKASIETWMVNRALYQQYGGRIIYQQMGPEPLDAMHDYLQEQEQKGAFRILEKSFEAPFWDYFVNDSKHDFFKQGSKEEKQAFATPPWLRKQA